MLLSSSFIPIHSSSPPRAAFTDFVKAYAKVAELSYHREVGGRQEGGRLLLLKWAKTRFFDLFLLEFLSRKCFRGFHP